MVRYDGVGDKWAALFSRLYTFPPLRGCDLTQMTATTVTCLDITDIIAIPNGRSRFQHAARRSNVPNFSSACTRALLGPPQHSAASPQYFRGQSLEKELYLDQVRLVPSRPRFYSDGILTCPSSLLSIGVGIRLVEIELQSYRTES
jgi:hypothetical protein